jgi:tRNA pseudouridine32 synthase/23S rRNA pseudouridine746 synthase
LNPALPAQVFTLFEEPLDSYDMPTQFSSPFDYKPHPLSLLAVKKLQSHLTTQNDWYHNFGLGDDKEGTVIGKMFGVLVVRTQQNELGYISAFSGKLAGGNHHDKFVPPIFDGLSEGGFLNHGMSELARMNVAMDVLKGLKPARHEEISLLLAKRRAYSVSLQNKIFDQYHFLNRDGHTKSLLAIFEKHDRKPPAGAGECAAPKMLQYAFAHRMKPLAMAEFWWGLSPKSDHWKHGHFYPSCLEKCAPILAHMLSGMELENKAL